MIDLQGNRESVRVSASDVGNVAECDLYWAVKVRPGVTSPVWSRRRPRHGKRSPFPLGDVLRILETAQRASGIDTHVGLTTWLAQELERRRIPRLLRPWTSTAVENALDAHEAIEHELGPLEQIDENPETGPDERVLSVWAPVYGNSSGVREVRRFRHGSAHQSPTLEDIRWANTAAFVVTKSRSTGRASRVRVIEIGLLDGSISVLFDGSPEQAIDAFSREGRDIALQRTEGLNATPCLSCGDCRIAGACDALAPVRGMFGQEECGFEPRSISQTELEKYQRCPAQWLLDSKLHFPKDYGTSEAQVRGQAVHRWLQLAHERGRACSIADLPEPGAGLGLAEGALSPEDYVLAHPYLVHHVDACPLSADDISVVGVERNVRGFDSDAHLVVAAKPDLMYMLEDRLIVREVKTAGEPVSLDRGDAYDKYPQIAFMLAFLASGLADYFGASAASVELELLTPGGQEVWAWDTEDEGLVRMAAGDVRRSAEEWHFDSEWETNPGPQCGWCPVRRWCPDRDRGQLPGKSPSSGSDPLEEALDEPPF
jgi:hypothetical protein